MENPQMGCLSLMDEYTAYRQKLIAWYKVNARVLPWRTQPTLYKTVVSEFMLQQTQVKTVLPYFEQWLRSFPNFEALALAKEEVVMQHWAGLGYYSRARHLHRLAKIVLEKHPQSYEDWLALEGVGRYTAAAIASIGLNETVAVVDGNVVRVLARLTNEQRCFKTKELSVRYFAQEAQSRLCSQRPGEYNEAIMELGATICTKHLPQCSKCPVKDFCKAYGAKSVACCPSFMPTKRQKITKKRLWIVQNGQILLELSTLGGKRDTKGLGLLELPEFTSHLENNLRLGELCFVGKRSIGNCDYAELVYKAFLVQGANLEKCVWVTLDALATTSISGPHKRWLKTILNKEPRRTEQRGIH